MNYIIKYGKNFIAISDRIEADCHKHWLLQMFLSSHKNLNIEVNGQRISCKAILVNIGTPHMFYTEGELHFTMLIDPTTELGRRMRGLLMDHPFYIFPHEETVVMQRAFKEASIQNRNSDFLSLVQSIILQFTYNDVVNIDNRVMKVLSLLNDRVYEEKFHGIKYFSKETGLSESRLSHLFKEETGVPLKSYIVLSKLQRAYESIFNGQPITTAALNAGFDSPSHLAYTNKMMTGMSATNIIKDSEFLKA